MKKSLTQERLKELLHYDAKTGVFTWLVGRYCVKAGTVAGSTHKRSGYRNIRIDFGLYREHRLAWLYVHGRWPTHQIDHINRIKTDNRIDNLRDVDGVANQLNTAPARGFIQRSPRSFEVKIRKSGKVYQLGCYPTAEAASAVYVAAKAAHRQEMGMAA